MRTRAGVPSQMLPCQMLQGCLFPIINTIFIKPKYSHLFTKYLVFFSSSYPKTQHLVNCNKNQLIAITFSIHFTFFLEERKLFTWIKTIHDISYNVIFEFCKAGQVYNVECIPNLVMFFRLKVKVSKNSDHMTECCVWYLWSRSRYRTWRYMMEVVEFSSSGCKC